MSALPAYDHSDHEMDDHSDSDHNGGPSSQAAAAAASGRPPPRKRNRAALSCTLCRERKVKCDRVIPCTQCIKRGDQEHCHLDPTKTGPKGRQAQAAAAAAAAAVANGTHPIQRGIITPAQQLPQHSGSSASPSFTRPPQPASARSAPSPTGPTSELEAVKARLAQLEAALSTAGNSLSQPQHPSFVQSPGDYRRESGPATDRYPHSATPGIPSSTLPPFVQSSTTGDPFALRSVGRHSSPYSSHRSNSAISSYTSPPGMASQPSPIGNLFANPNGDGVARLPPIQPAAQSPGGMGFGPFDGRFGRGQSVASSSGSVSGRASAHDREGASSGAVDRSTPSSRGEPTVGRHEIDSDTEDAAQVLERLAMGATGGARVSAKVSNGRSPKAMQVDRDHDVIQRSDHNSIQRFVERDRAKDIMADGSVTKEDFQAVARTQGVNFDDPRCTAVNKGIAAEMADLDSDTEVDAQGRLISPVIKVCRAVHKSKPSLFRVISGPETHLGWGMGWAFAAAEAADDFAPNKAPGGSTCPGATQRESILRAIIRTLPSLEIAQHLIDVYDSRIKTLAGNVIHMPSFRKEVEAFYALGTVEKRARVVHIVDPAWLALFLMVLVLSLHFHPCERPENVMHLFDGRVVHMWRSAAKTTLVLARYQTSSSMAVLSTILLLNLHASGIGRESYTLLQVAIANARQMGLDRLGSRDQQPKAGENEGILIRRELGKRIWHDLVFKDWATATCSNGTYSIHPDHFNTPLPSNINDEDLVGATEVKERPATEYTEMSFVRVKYELCKAMREHVDLENKRALEGTRINCQDTAYLDARFRGILENAPEWYRVGSEIGAGTGIEVERWLLQQSVFHKLLRLHRPKLSSLASARTSCVLLARSILDMQRRIRSRCTVVDRLLINLSQSFSAAIVLCLDLLQARPPMSYRDLVRRDIEEALKALRHVESVNQSAARSIHVIEALLAEEEARWNADSSDEPMDGGGLKRKRDAHTGQRKKSLLSLALRVARAANGEEEGEAADAKPTAAAASTPGPSFSIPGFPWDSTQSGYAPQPDQAASFANYMPPTDYAGQQVVAPNGLDLNDAMSANDQAFDISKFLAEYGSPGSGSDEAGSVYGGSTSSGAASTNSSGFRMNSASSASVSSGMGASPQDSPIAESKMANSNSSNAVSGVTLPATSVPDLARSAPPSAPVEPATANDAFWGWLLSRGGVTLPPPAEPEAPMGQQLPGMSDASVPLGQSSALAMASSGFPTTALPSSEPMAAPSPFTALLQSAGGLPTPRPSHAPASTSSQNVMSGGQHHLGAHQPAVSTPSASDVNVFVGTPSAGLGFSTRDLWEFASEQPLSQASGGAAWPSA